MNLRTKMNDLIKLGEALSNITVEKDRITFLHKWLDNLINVGKRIIYFYSEDDIDKHWYEKYTPRHIMMGDFPITVKYEDHCIYIYSKDGDYLTAFEKRGEYRRFLQLFRQEAAIESELNDEP